MALPAPLALRSKATSSPMRGRWLTSPARPAISRVAGARGATTSQWSWSDAGTVSADVSGFSWGGSFAAAGGRYAAADGTVHADSRANGGTILLGGGNISLQQGAAGVISAPTTLTVSADQLAPFDNVYLYAAAAVGGAARIFTDLPGTTYGDSDPSVESAHDFQFAELDRDQPSAHCGR